MNNYKFYEKEIIETFRRGDDVAVANGTLTTCKAIECSDCDFRPTCYEGLAEWLEKEHVEKGFPASKLIHDCRIIVGGQNFHFCKFSEGTLWYYPKGHSAWTIKNDKTALILCTNPYNENNVYLPDGTRVIME